LLIGCGDIGLRLVILLAGRVRVYALTRNAESRRRAAALGALALSGDLAERESLRNLPGGCDAVAHFAPPPPRGREDHGTANLISALERRRSLPRRFVYLSTTGVYGDCGGAKINESRPIAPASERALRRADAEQRLRDWARRRGVGLCILRVPGIYSAERLPAERLRRGTPVLRAADDSYSSHIHADDLARAVLFALCRGASGRVYNACDNSEMKMGDYLSLVATTLQLPQPQRVARVDAEATLPETLLSFMRESRRIDNTRLRHELRLQLRYPTVFDGLAEAGHVVG
jgi:nucleoside-diphosphate-sugar epimerase